MTIGSIRGSATLISAVTLLVAGCGVAPSGTASSSPSGGAAEPAEAIAPYPGWTELARLHPGDVGSHGEAVAAGDRETSGRFLLVSAVCTTGNLAITTPGPVDPSESSVECPVLADPERSIAFVGDEVVSWEVRVVPNGTVDFEVLIEGSDVPLHIPAIVLTAGDKTIEMQGGCWTISLSWGYVASDQCGRTIPEERIETIHMERGAAVTVAIDGWTISRADALCGRLKQAGGNLDDLFQAMPACTVQATLDGGEVRLQGLTPSPDPWLVELAMSAEAAWSDQFSGPFYAYVSVP